MAGARRGARGGGGRVAARRGPAATPRPLLFGVVQGGNDRELRRRCAEAIIEMGFDGYAFGGWPFDSSGRFLADILHYTAELVPDEKPKYALGIGNPDALIACVKMGYGLFDCALPTRDARRGRLYLFRSAEPADLAFDRLYIHDDRHRRDASPLSEHCDCLACRRYSRAYLHHLFAIRDSLAHRLATLHNLRFYTQLIERLTRNGLRSSEAPAMTRSRERPQRIHGIDFSGSAMAGRKVWIASGHAEGDRLVIESCRSGETLPGSGRAREQCLAALCRFIEQGEGDAFGLDFPFGLPEELVDEKTWEEFVRAFPGRFADPVEFRAACRQRAAGKDLKRRTDRETRTPFAAYNLWLFRQTFYGIRDVLGPLVRNRSACVLPMQAARPGEPWVLEACPASTLKRLEAEIHQRLYVPYKGKQPEHREARGRILSALGGECGVVLADRRLRETIVADPEGDALDSVIAALAVAHALRDATFPRPAWCPAYALEGYVYA